MGISMDTWMLLFIALVNVFGDGFNLYYARKTEMNTNSLVEKLVSAGKKEGVDEERERQEGKR